MIYSNAITQGKIKQVHSETKNCTEESTMHWINRRVIGAGLLGIAFADLWLLIVEKQFVPLLMPPFLCFFYASPPAMLVVFHIVWFIYGILFYFSWRFYIWPMFTYFQHTSHPKKNE